MANLTIQVVDSNNLDVIVDSSVSGVGISNVAIEYVPPSTYYLVFTYTNGTTESVELPSVSAGVLSFNTRIGNVTLLFSDVTGALGYTPPTPTGTGATGTWNISVLGNAATVTNGVVTTGTYSDPNWITALSSSKLTGQVAIANGGTNATTAANARVNLLPSYTGNGNKRLGLNSGATDVEWVTDGGGTVTSVGGTGSVNGITLTGLVTSSGNLTLGGTLGSINNSQLSNSKVTIGTTDISLGTSSTTLAGLTSVSSTSFTGALTGNADTVTNGVVTTGSYSNPSWITALAGAKITGDIAGNAGTVTNGVYTTDIGTVTNTMLAGSIANNKLSNSAITINGNTVNLGGSTTVTASTTSTLTIGTGLSGTSFNGSTPVTIAIANTGVTATSYGTASKTSTLAINSQGQVTSASEQNIAIANTQISGLGTASTKDAGSALGVATLDSSGKVPISQIPDSVIGALSYQGTWNASTNTPTLVSSVGTKGYYYVVSVDGNTNLNGITDWLIGDWAVYSGTSWQKIDNTDSVTSVNGLTGTVVLTTTNVAEGTNLYYTDARARASVSAGTGISYSSATGVITNTAPDQTVALTAGTGISTSGTYPNFTITNTSPSLGGTVTSVSGTGTVNGLTLTGTVTTSGSLTLGGTLNLSSPPAIGGTTPAAIAGTTITAATEFISENYKGLPSLGGNLKTNAGVSLLNWDGAGLGNITINGGLNANPANKNVSLAPTGTGSVTINPATAGTMNNMVIGGTTPLAITGTTVTATSFVGSGTSLTNVVNSASAGTGISVSGATGAVTITNTAPDQTVAIASGTGISVTGTYPSFTVTNTAPSSGGTVTSVTGTAPISVATGTTTPVISIPAASGSVNGYLSSTDWTTFNSKQPAGTYVNSVSGTTGRITSTGGTTPVIDLASGVATAGTTGSSTLIPVVTIDTYGRVTGITTAANPQGTVTSVSGTGTVSGISLSGTITSSGSLTLGGTLDLSIPPTIGGTTPNTGKFTSITDTGLTATRITYAGTAGLLQDSANLTFNGTDLSTTNLAYTGTLTGGTGVVNLGSGQFYKDASGNVGIGNASPTGKLDVSGFVRAIDYLPVPTTGTGVEMYYVPVATQGYIGSYDRAAAQYRPLEINGSQLVFGTSTAGAERMRIDSSGNLLVGTTGFSAYTPRIQISGTTGSLGLISGRQTTNTAGKYYNWGPTTDASPYWIVYNESNVGVYIAPGGNTWTSASDETIKDIIEPIADAIQKVGTLRSVIGKYKTDEEGTRRSFLIAQDVQKVLPEAVTVSPDGTLGLQYQDIIPLLVAMNKEQQALIESLTTRLTALENK